MLGLILVSHSRALAQSLRDLIQKMVGETLPIVACGGSGEQKNELGTDASEIIKAIESLPTEEILILGDMGSSILSSKMALELFMEATEPLESDLSEDISEEATAIQKKTIRISSAPLVEGAISASLQIQAGNGLNLAMIEALESLLPKQSQLEDSNLLKQVKQEEIDSELSKENREDDSNLEEEKSQVFLIQNPQGLHARPAARIVQIASSFSAELTLENLDRPQKRKARANSLNQIALLEVLKGQNIRVRAKGRQAQESLDAIALEIQRNFGEGIGVKLKPENEKLKNEKPKDKKEEASSKTILAVSAGIAIGQVYFVQKSKIQVSKKTISDPKKEIQQFKNVILSAQKQIQAQIALFSKRAESEIFSAHLLMLGDPELLDRISEKIQKEKKNSSWAWSEEIEELRSLYQSSESEYLRQRSKDIEDIRDRVLRILETNSSASNKMSISKPSIWLFEELNPSDLADMDHSFVLGIVARRGSYTSHSSILCRSLGIPCIVDPSLMEKLKEENWLVFDGETGKSAVNPSESLLKEWQKRKEILKKQEEELLSSAREPAVSLDGTTLAILANIGNQRDAKISIEQGADGVGLFRTELFFLDRERVPNEEEQYQEFSQVIRAMQGSEVIVRTLDIGGDKEVPSLGIQKEEDPFLGVRGIRLCLKRKDLFHPHLRAILRASAESKSLKIMIPMVSQVQDFTSALEEIKVVHRELESEGIDHLWPIPIGMMVETPSSVYLLEELAEHSDFFSIGTNDLTQYLMSASRVNPELDAYQDALHPAVLRCIYDIVKKAHKRDRKVSLCGELGSDPMALVILFGLGVDSLSMNPSSIPKIKNLLRKLEKGQAQKLALELLEYSSSIEIRNKMKAFLHHHVIDPSS